MPRGKEIRCNGYTSDDGKWCFCGRIADSAHHETDSPAGPLYAHLLRDEPLVAADDFTMHEPVEKEPRVQRIVAEYNYLNDAGELAYQVVRLEPKSFRQRRPNGSPGSWIWSLAGVPRVMYRAREVAASDGVVFLVEGEKDADALAQLGLQATTSSGGARGVKPSLEAGRALLRGRDVCIVPDGDEDGAAYAAAWRDALDGVAKSVRVVKLEQKDASDAIAAGATARTFLELWTQAAQVDERPRIAWLPLAELVAPLPPINWICQSLRLAPGAVSCLSGYGYSGKTALAMALLLAVGNGRSFLDVMSCEPGVCGQLDYEQGKRLSVQRMQRLCRGAGLPLEEGLRNWRFCPFPEHYVDNEKGRDVIARSVEGMKVCMIDSGRASMPGIEENDSKSRIHIDGLSRVSEKTGTAFLMILHDGKGGEDKRGKERTRGSSAIYDAMQTVWGCDKREGEDFIRAELRKDRLSGSDGEFGFKFVDSPGPYDAPDSWVKIQHLDPEQMKGKSTLDSRVDAVVEAAKLQPGLNKTALASLVRGKTALTYTAIQLAEERKRLALLNGGYRAV